MDFRAEDKTVSAIVSLPFDTPSQTTHLEIPVTMRHSYLPDAASGVFAPGWDISFDENSSGIEHSASYGLGSPFPEGAKLCAALGAFWPAVAPDASRTFQPNASDGDWPTVSPLTDKEIGIIENLPWDGIKGPQYISEDNEVEYSDFDHADYTLNAINNRFSLSLTGKVGVEEYQSRVLSMARVYTVLRSFTTNQRAKWGIISFREVSQGDSELDSAQSTSGISLISPIYRFEIFEHGATKPSPDNDHKKIRVTIVGSRRILFVSPSIILMRIGNGGLC